MVPELIFGLSAIVVLLALRVPIYIVLMGVPSVFLLSHGESLAGLGQKALGILERPAMIAVPFFILAAEFMRDDALIIVRGRNHALAEQEAVPPEALGEQIWLTNRVGSVARVYLEELTQRYGWSEDNRCYITMHIPDLTLKMLVTGDYLAIIPHSVAQPCLDQGAAVQISPELSSPIPPLGAVYNGVNTGSATLKLIDHILQAERT